MKIFILTVALLMPINAYAAQQCIDLSANQVTYLLNAKATAEAMYNKTWTNAEFHKQLLRWSVRYIKSESERITAETDARNAEAAAMATFDAEFPNDLTPATTTTTATLPSATTTTLP